MLGSSYRPAERLSIPLCRVGWFFLEGSGIVTRGYVLASSSASFACPRAEVLPGLLLSTITFGESTSPFRGEFFSWSSITGAHVTTYSEMVSSGERSSATPSGKECRDHRDADTSDSLGPSYSGIGSPLQLVWSGVSTVRVPPFYFLSMAVMPLYAGCFGAVLGVRGRGSGQVHSSFGDV